MLHACRACVIGFDTSDLLERCDLCVGINILQRAVAASQLDRQCQRLCCADVCRTDVDVVVDIVVILIARNFLAGIDRLLIHHDIRTAVRAACDQVQRHVCAAAGDLRCAGNTNRAAVRNSGFTQIDTSRNTVAARGDVGDVERLGNASAASCNRLAASEAGIRIGFSIGSCQIDGVARAIISTGN